MADHRKFQSQLTPRDIEKIIDLHTNYGLPFTALAERFHVGPAAISDLIKATRAKPIQAGEC